jgi:hypothetical protein
MSYDTHEQEWLEEELEQLSGISQDPQERSFKEQRLLRKISAPTAEWLHQVSLQDNHCSLLDTQTGVYRVTVEQLSEEAPEQANE